MECGTQGTEEGLLSLTTTTVASRHVQVSLLEIYTWQQEHAWARPTANSCKSIHYLKIEKKKLTMSMSHFKTKHLVIACVQGSVGSGDLSSEQ